MREIPVFPDDIDEPDLHADAQAAQWGQFIRHVTGREGAT